MRHFWMAIIAVGMAACGGEDGGEGAKAPEDYVDQDLLARAENEHQRLCLISGALVITRGGQCGIPVASTMEDLQGFCLDLPPEIPPAFQSQSDQCFNIWASAPCADLFGHEGDPCVLQVE